MKASVFAVVTLGMGMAAAAEPISLKGLRPGMTKAEMNAVHLGFTYRCANVAKVTPPSEVCAYPTPGGNTIEALATLAGAPVERWYAILRDEKTHTISVTMKSDDFERVRAALEERWGKPTNVETGTVSNPMGAKFDQIHLRWYVDGTVLSVRKRGTTADKMSVLLGDAADIAEQGRQRREVQPKKDAKDM